MVNFATSGLSDAQVTIINYPGTGDVFYFTKTPMVRAVLAPGCADYSVVGVSELPAQLENVSVAPNSPRARAKKALAKSRLMAA